MDVVYVVKPDEHNEELRYSLRSLANIPHDRVWIAGYKPKFVSEKVHHIPVPAQPSKHLSSTANLRAACRTNGVSEEFAYFNDDFFVLHPVTTLGCYDRGAVQDVLALNPPSRYRTGGEQTLRLIQDYMGIDRPRSFELHVPMVLEKQLMLEALKIGQGIPALHKRTLYGNLFDLPSRPAQDCKIKDLDSAPPLGSFVSTTEHSFAYGRVGDVIRRLFPVRSPYER